MKRAKKLEDHNFDLSSFRLTAAISEITEIFCYDENIYALALTDAIPSYI